MCDTLVATPAATLHNEMILAKNSDREPNEAQNITFVPAARHPRGSVLRCTYIEIPQGEQTYACLLSRPFWMWGAEMGVNEKGLAIGNEAVFTKERYGKTGLTGMDLLRIALERASTARGAIALISELLEMYGQGGNCGYESTLFYHNSFMIADPEEAFILETAGKHWVAKKVITTASISNCLTIGDDYTLASPGIEAYARMKRYTKKDKQMNFARDFSDFLFTHFAKGKVRQACSASLLAIGQKKVTSRAMFSLLRNHNMPEPFVPGMAPMERICLHAGGIISTQTTGSMVAVLRKKLPPLVYFTGTSAPCLSIFKPHIISEGQKKISSDDFARQLEDGSWDLYGSASGAYDARTLWWKGEEIHRRVIMNYQALSSDWQVERDALEEEMVSEVEEDWRAGAKKVLAKSCRVFRERFNARHASLAEEIKIKSAGIKPTVPSWYRMYWKRMNRKASFH